ncbi:MAG: TlpA disulfide reductase family protein [Candidatus Bathyarchaeota archaeon]|jgi:peroxiredoxin
MDVRKVKEKLCFLLFFTLSFLIIPVIAQQGAPDFSLTDIDGNQFSLSDYRGQVVLLNFFHTMCSGCIEEIPHLKSLHTEFSEDLIIISISVASFDTDERLLEFRQNHDINWIVSRDTASIVELYNVEFVPMLVIVDQDGDICHQHIGETEYSILYEEIFEIVPEFGSLISIIFVLMILSSFIVIYKILARQTLSHAR